MSPARFPFAPTINVVSKGVSLRCFLVPLLLLLCLTVNDAHCHTSRTFSFSPRGFWFLPKTQEKEEIDSTNATKLKTHLLEALQTTLQDGTDMTFTVGPILQTYHGLVHPPQPTNWLERLWRTLRGERFLPKGEEEQLASLVLADLEQTKQKIRELSQEIAAAQEEAQRMNYTVMDRDMEVAMLKNKLSGEIMQASKLASKLEEAQKEIVDTSASLQKQIQEDKHAFQQNLSHKQAEIERLESDLETKRGCEDVLKEVMNSLQQAVSRERDQLQDLQARYRRLEMEHQTLSSQARELQRDKTTLDRQVARLSEEGQQLRSQLREPKDGSHDEIQKDLATWQQKCRRMEEEASQRRHVEDELKERIAGLMAQKGSSEEAQELREECKRLRRDNKLLEEEKEASSRASMELTSAKKLLEDQRLKVEKLRSQLAQLESSKEAHQSAEREAAAGEASAEAAITALEKEIQELKGNMEALEGEVISKDVELEQCKQLLLSLGHKPGGAEPTDSHHDQATIDAMRAQLKKSREETHSRLRELAEQQAGSASARPRPFGVRSGPLFGVRGSQDQSK